MSFVALVGPRLHLILCCWQTMSRVNVLYLEICAFTSYILKPIKKPVSKPLYINELILFSILHAYYVIQTLITTRTSNFLTAGWKIALTYTSMYMYIAFIRDRKNCNSSNYEWWMLWRWPFTSYQWPWPLFVLTSTQQFFKYIKRARWSWAFLD